MWHHYINGNVQSTKNTILQKILEVIGTELESFGTDCSLRKQVNQISNIELRSPCVADAITLITVLLR